MLKKKYMMFFSVVIIAVLLGGALYYGIAQGVGEYDPWIDLNDDGTIDIFDAVTLAGVAGTSGTPINKTALLLQLLDRVDNLNSSLLDLEACLETKITELNASVVELQTIVATLEATVSSLETRVETLESKTGLPPPDYDSGWVSISQGQNLMLTHNLNTREVLVYLVGKMPDGDVHHIDYGGVYVSGWYGGHWQELKNNTIEIYRCSNDNYYPQMRVMLWKIQEPPT